jgi:hypothetical protein
MLRECGVFVGAFSMIETWLSNDGQDYPLARAPWKVNPLAARPHTLTFEQVRESVKGIVQAISRINPQCHVFLGVDPVPLHATHSEIDCIIADSRAKAELVAGTMRGIEESGSNFAHYIPLYEQVHYCERDPWDHDERHINTKTIQNVYQVLLSSISAQINM